MSVCATGLWPATRREDAHADAVPAPHAADKRSPARDYPPDRAAPSRLGAIHIPAARVALPGRVMDACVISVIGVTLRKRGSDSRTGRRMCPVLRSRAGGTNMLNSYAPSTRGEIMSPEALQHLQLTKASSVRHRPAPARIASNWYSVNHSLPV